MPKVNLDDVASLANETSFIASFNANNALIEEGFNNTISRNGLSPNTMESMLDMNNHRLVNVPLVPLSNADVATKYYVDYKAGDIADATPTNPNDAVITGDLSVGGDLTVTGTITGTITGFLANVVEDTTPQLGGDLDTQGNDITGLTNLTLTGTDGLDVDPATDTDASLITVGVTGTPTLSWDESSDAFSSNKPWVISSDGNGDVTHTIAGASVTSDLEVHSTGTADLGGIAIHRHTDTNDFGGHLLFLRSDGTHASPTAVDDNDTLGRMIGLGYDGTDYELSSEIRFLIDGIPGNNDMPGEIKFYTNAGSQTLTERMNIQADGSVNIAGSTLTVNSNNVAISETLASTSNGAGASLIGIEDSGALITATTVEGALAENRTAIDAIEADYLTSSDIGTSVQGFDADTLKADTPDTLTAGFAHTVDNDGTQSSGTYTPDQDGGNMKRIVNGGAFTLAPPVDDCCIILQITNNASAGVITTSGFTGVFGDIFTTTNGDDFICTIIKINGFSSLTVQDVS